MKRDLTIVPMTPAYAGEIQCWQYEPPYDIYSLDATQDTTDELLGGSYFAVLLDKQLVGFFCYGEPAQVPGGRAAGCYSSDFTDLGLGIRPDLTGRGLGVEFVTAGIDFAARCLGLTRLRLSVAAFNKRAIGVYRKCGFAEEHRFASGTGDSQREFVLMIRPD